MSVVHFFLDNPYKYGYTVVMKSFTTQEVANTIGVGKRTLLRWLYEGKLAEPKRIRFGRQSYRIWTEKDLRKAQEYKNKHYRKKPRRKLKENI